jgi:hypothetical protein
MPCECSQRACAGRISQHRRADADGTEHASLPLCPTFLVFDLRSRRSPLPPVSFSSHRSPSALVAELNAILEESAASMRGAAELASGKDKAAWWRTRLALDERLAALLQRAGRGWLGPWRCLLAQPAESPAREAELRQVAAAFVAEHFDFIFGGSPPSGRDACRLFGMPWPAFLQIVMPPPWSGGPRHPHGPPALPCVNSPSVCPCHRLFQTQRPASCSRSSLRSCCTPCLWTLPRAAAVATAAAAV